jgi:hypothetical protein
MTPGLKFLWEIPSGARVRKPSARPINFAFGREGIVIRETFADKRHVGVLFDGASAVIEYPDNTELEVIG